jgi:peptide/nickel transport system permease protein
MQTYVIRRLLQGVPVLFVVSLIVFGLMQLVPGDPVLTKFGAQPGVTAEMIEEMRRQWGLDRPAHVQYLVWLGNILRGDLGLSFTYVHYPVSDLILQKLPATLELTVASLFVALIVAIPAGILSAVKPNSWMDYFVSLFVTMGMAIPGFWLGIMLILVFAVQLKWLPASGYVPINENPSQNLKHLILPAVTLSILLMAPVMRFMRSSMLEVIREDYVRTARAKGLAEIAVIRSHVLKNALIPTITVVGLQFAGLLGGVVVIEWVFAWPGIGWLAVQAIFQRDYTVVQSTVLLVATSFVLINLIVDVLYAVVDPRIHYE